MKIDYEQKRKDFINMLMAVSREEIAEFIKLKGKEPKQIKPFICLDNITGGKSK